jgi:two-component system NtrC family sensor kinase
MVESHLVKRERLLASQVAALEQLLEVYEQAVLAQSGRLETTQLHLARRVEELGESNDALRQLNDQLNSEIAERKSAQENLRRSERLASIGTLAAGLAHEINNPLGLIALEVHHASRHSDDIEALSTSLVAIEGYVKRCARIVKSVLQFAREETTEKWPVSLNTIAENARDLTREKARRCSVSIELDLAPDLPELVLNPTEMEQVFVNLIHNAINASERGARVIVATEHDNGAIRSVVRDDGCGMTQQGALRAFDPFYTTRSQEGGTGLGLSTCKGIVTDLGGTIEIDSKRGTGTVVTVSLPVDGLSGGGG